MERRYRMLSLILGTLVGFLALSTAHAQTKAPEVVKGEYLVRLKSMTSPAGMLGRMQSRMMVKSSFRNMSLYHMSIRPGTDEAKTVADLKSDPDVAYVEPNYILHKADLDASSVNQPLQTFSAGQVATIHEYSSDSNTYTQSNAPTNVAAAWGVESTTTTVRPIVAIVDTGVDPSHSVFQQSGALWVNTGEIANNGIDDDANGYVDDVNGWNFITGTNDFMDDDGHGTHVSGIIVGTGLNIFNSPITETAKMRIMPLKFLDSTGSGTTANAVNAIYYAVNNGARVINNSWGGNSYSLSLHEVLTYAYNNQVFIASAAGNNSADNDTTTMYPANYDVPSNMSVAATTDYDALASFSDYGPNSVPIASPGVFITSTLPNNTFGVMSGTSMATPFISGMAALAIREAPQLTGYQVKNLIVSGADAISDLNGVVTSASRVDALGLINLAIANVNTPASQPAYTPDYQSDGSSTTTQAGGCGLVGSALMGRHHGDSSGGSGDNAAGILAGLMLLPLILWTILRQRAMEPVTRRRYERFVMSSDIKVMVGDRELVGSMKTISLGGASFNADTALEKGGIITLKIASPDGAEVAEVQGQVVWSEANKAYGVQFANAEQGTLSMIQKWTRGLNKAA